MVSNRIPLRTTLQLTYNCNFKCLHCYQTPIKNHNAVELSVKEWVQILKTLKLNGCMFLSMTGGEILVKQDFSDIYKAAYDMGYKITLSTNGSLLNDDHLALLKENKPIAVFVTIYGSSNSSYHHFCRTDIPSKAILNNIAKLKQRGVDTRIKVIANKIIKDEIAVIRQFSKYHEMPFNIYGKINCYIDGNSYPKSL